MVQRFKNNSYIHCVCIYKGLQVRSLAIWIKWERSWDIWDYQRNVSYEWILIFSNEISA